MSNFNIQTAQQNAANAYAKANQKYIARNKAPQLDPKTGMQDDIAKGLKFALSMSEGAMRDIEEGLQISWAHVGHCIENATNVKVALRIPQFLSFAVTGLASDLKGSAKTALLVFASLMHNAQNRAGIMYAVTGKGDEHAADNLRGYQNALKLLRAVGAVGSSTAKTQISVSITQAGILPALGMVTLEGKMPVLNLESPATKHFMGIIAGLRDGQLQDLAEALTTKKK